MEHNTQDSIIELYEKLFAAAPKKLSIRTRAQQATIATPYLLQQLKNYMATEHDKNATVLSNTITKKIELVTKRLEELTNRRPLVKNAQSYDVRSCMCHESVLEEYANAYSRLNEKIHAAFDLGLLEQDDQDPHAKIKWNGYTLPQYKEDALARIEELSLHTALAALKGHLEESEDALSEGAKRANQLSSAHRGMNDVLAKLGGLFLEPIISPDGDNEPTLPADEYV